MNKSKLTKDYTNYKWSYGERAPKEDLEYLKVTCNLSNEEIAKILNSSSSNIGRWLSFYKIRKPAPKVNAPIVTEHKLNKIDWSKLSRKFIENPWKRTDIPIKEDFEYLRNNRKSTS